ncbi:hypothetical protein ASPVEDRAFT_107469, partial [Aspergillus versicolor CBS 583.65]
VDSERKCYFPSGVLAVADVPCSGEQYTSCCDHRAICLSNGLCMSTTIQPYTLSRGSCTNQKWDQGCPQYCADCNPDGGCGLFTFSYKSKVAQYCCGSADVSNTTTKCYDGSNAFRVPDAEAVPGYALLGNITSFNASTDSPDSPNNTSCPIEQTNTSSCHETAVGAGIGVPLGVIALASVAWALWERRKGKQASNSAL